MRKRSILTIPLVLVLVTGGCEIAQQIKERFNVFSVDFSFQGVSLTPVIPQDAQTILNLLAKQKAGTQDISLVPDISQYASQTGLTITCAIAAGNPNEDRAVFDGAAFYLRLNDTTEVSTPLRTSVDPFTIEGSDSTLLEIDFPLMLDNSAISANVFEKVISGDSIPYALDADLTFHLLGGGVTGLPDTLASRTVPLDLVHSALPTRVDDEGLFNLLATMLNLVR